MTTNGVNGSATNGDDYEGEFGHGIQVIDENKEFTSAMPEYLTTTNVLQAGFSYHLISVFGSQSTGKSTLLNHLFNTAFPVMSESRRQQTTKGIWMSLATDPNASSNPDEPHLGKNILVMDVEGTDGRERGEDQDFERKSALFAIATSEVLIVNIWEHQVGLYQGANMGLLKTVFEVNLQLFQKDKATVHRSLLFFVIRDHIGHTPLENLKNTLLADLNNIWHGLSKPPGLETSSISDFFDFTFATLPHKLLQPDQFKLETQKLKLRFREESPTNATYSADGVLDTSKNGVFLPSYHRRIPADGLPHYAGNIWRMITENKDLDLPTQQELLAQYRCDEISVVCVELFDEVITPFEAALSQKIVQAGLGPAMKTALDTALSKFKEEAGRYHKVVYKRKLEDLEKKLLARLKVLYVAQLTAAHKNAIAVFSDTIQKGIKRSGADFASLVTETRATVLADFTSEAEGCSLDGAFSYTDELHAVEKDLDEGATRLRGEEMTRLLARMEKSLRGKFTSEDDGVAYMFKTISPTLYPRIWTLFTTGVTDQIALFTQRSTALNATAEENEQAVYKLKKRAWKVLRMILDEETKEQSLITRLMGYFDKDFRYDDQGVPRVWKAGEDIEGTFAKSKETVLNLIPNLATFQLEDSSKPPLATFIGDAPEGAEEEVGAAAEDEEEEDVASPTSTKTFTILTPGRITSLTESFNRQADQAFVDAKRGTISSVSQIPVWFYGLLVVLGWNEFWAVIRNPLYFMMLLLAAVGAYVAHTLNLWGPIITVGGATGRQALEVGKEKLREFLEMPQPNYQGAHAFSSGNSTSSTQGESIRMRNLTSEGKNRAFDDDD
ncbi:Dynamin-like GTPase that mediates homotypic ER fusion [Arthrobotrys musiformis]|uniref:Dynamin-like GTPase that mediates homotypic ER fusion n=1 Tax=Arthrobotrys musiformis TaxID=47236 RepID=A0AAV9VXA5_9PEZI